MQPVISLRLIPVIRPTKALNIRLCFDLVLNHVGVHTYEDVLKAMLARANVTILASELLESGLGRIGEILQEMTGWMEQHGLDSVVRMRGLAQQFSAAEPAAFEQASYTKAILSRDPTGITSQSGS